MTKIYINKTDSLTSIIEKIIKSPDKEVVLYIPRGSLLASSRNNFKLLKREAGSAGKVVSIESVDDDVLELADSFDIKSVNPFFGKKRSVTDIVVKETPTEVLEEKPAKVKIEPPLKITPKATILEKKKDNSELWVGGPVVAEETVRPSFYRRLAKILITIGIASILSWVAVYVLPQAKIELVLEKINWDFSGSVVVSSSRETPSFNNSTIELPGVIFTDNGNLTKAYPASGSKYVERKAAGTITVYNEYSSEQQVLVQNTRFSTPDGKIYRTDKKITVPGAKIVDGKIVASSIDLTVTADKAGEEYNINAVSKFRIPGLQGSPKYDAFYGTSTNPMSGGFVGEVKVPTEDDIAKAKEDLHNSLKGSLSTKIFLSMPTDIKILDKASEFSVTKEEVNKEADANGNFMITGFGEMKIMGFKESDLLSVLANKVAAESKVDLVLYDHSLKESNEGYGEPKLDFENGKMTFDLSFKSSWVRPFDVEDFKIKVASKNRAEITSLVYAVPGFKSGGVSLWPIWVRHAPKNTAKIIVDLGYTL